MITYSVITVCLNSSSTILDTINSVKNQNLSENIEHIFVDGYSDDETVKIITSNAINFKVVYSERLGVYSAMNVGLHHASGDYVIFLNSDDFFNGSNVIESYNNIIMHNPKLKLLASGIQYINSDKKIVGTWPVKNSDLFGLKQLPHPGVLLDRSFILSNEFLFDENLKIASDYKQQLEVKSHVDYSAFNLNSLTVSMRVGGISNASMSARLRGFRETFFIVSGLFGTTRAIVFSLNKIALFFIKKFGK